MLPVVDAVRLHFAGQPGRGVLRNPVERLPCGSCRLVPWMRLVASWYVSPSFSSIWSLGISMPVPPLIMGLPLASFPRIEAAKNSKPSWYALATCPAIFELVRLCSCTEMALIGHRLCSRFTASNTRSHLAKLETPFRFFVT